MWLLICNFLHAKLNAFVFDVTFAASNWQFISICSCIIVAYFLGFLSIRSWMVSAWDSNLLPGKFESHALTIQLRMLKKPKKMQTRGLLLLFECHLIELGFFCRVLVSICEAQLHLWFKYYFPTVFWVCLTFFFYAMLERTLIDSLSGFQMPQFKTCCQIMFHTFLESSLVAMQTFEVVLELFQ